MSVFQSLDVQPPEVGANPHSTRGETYSLEDFLMISFSSISLRTCLSFLSAVVRLEAALAGLLRTVILPMTWGQAFKHLFSLLQ